MTAGAPVPSAPFADLFERSSFNPKPEAMAGSDMDCPHVAPAIAFGFGFGLNDAAERSDSRFE